MAHNVRDQRRRAVGAPLADRNLWGPLAVPASGVTTSADRCIALLAGLAKFLAKHTTQGALERLVGAPHVFAQGSIDEGLVIAAAGLMHAALEPGDNVVVEADSNALLALGQATPLSARSIFAARLPTTPAQRLVRSTSPTLASNGGWERPGALTA